MSRQKMKKLRSQGLTYQQIADQLNCAKSTVCYHLGKNQKDKNLKRQQINRSKQHPYIKKIETFNNPTKPITQKPISKSKYTKIIYCKLRTFERITQKMKPGKPKIQVNDVIAKFGENPICYLTGEPIDITQTKTYHFDHITPRSRGGDNSLENLGICTKIANESKGNMTHEEYIEHCKEVLTHHGYKI